MARDEHGRFTAAHDITPDAVCDTMTVGTTYTTGELADMVDAPRRTVYEYLRELAADGRVTRKAPHDRLSLWRRVE